MKGYPPPGLARTVTLTTVGWAKGCCLKSGLLSCILFMAIVAYLNSPRTGNLDQRRRTLTIHPSKPYKSYPYQRYFGGRKKSLSFPDTSGSSAYNSPLNTASKNEQSKSKTGEDLIWKPEKKQPGIPKGILDGMKRIMTRPTGSRPLLLKPQKPNAHVDMKFPPLESPAPIIEPPRSRLMAKNMTIHRESPSLPAVISTTEIPKIPELVIPAIVSPDSKLMTPLNDDIRIDKSKQLKILASDNLPPKTNNNDNNNNNNNNSNSSSRNRNFEQLLGPSVFPTKYKYTDTKMGFISSSPGRLGRVSSSMAKYNDNKIRKPLPSQGTVTPRTSMDYPLTDSPKKPVFPPKVIRANNKLRAPSSQPKSVPTKPSVALKAMAPLLDSLPTKLDGAEKLKAHVPLPADSLLNRYANALNAPSLQDQMSTKPSNLPQAPTLLQDSKPAKPSDTPQVPTLLQDSKPAKPTGLHTLKAPEFFPESLPAKSNNLLLRPPPKIMFNA